MASPKFVTNQIVHTQTTNPNNTSKAVVLVAGTSGIGQNVYLVTANERLGAMAIQTLVFESQVGSAT